MEEKFQVQINGWIEGYRLTKEFMNLLETLNKKYFDEFMKLVKRHTLDCYHFIESKYINDMLYTRMKLYHKVLCELLDRCAPKGYYFGLSNNNLTSLYGDIYGYWKEEYPEDNLRGLITKEILKIRDETNQFSASSFRWRGDFWNFLRNENLEFYLNTKSDKDLLSIYSMVIRQNSKQG